MAFILGRGLTLADRWANTVAMQACLTGALEFPAGDIELGIDRTQCFKFAFGAHDMYVPINVVNSVGDVTISGPDPGTNVDGTPATPLTTLYLYPDPTSDTIYSEDWWWIYLRNDGTNRTRTFRMSHLNIQGPTGGPDPLVFRTHTSTAVARQTNAHFIKHIGINDTTIGGFDHTDMTSSPGDQAIFTNVRVLTGSRFPTFLETSSGSSSLLRFVDCELRGNTECLHIFGSGPTPLQPLGKRLEMLRTKLIAVYDQQPGVEVAGLGGNGIYHHPTVNITADFCEFGSPAGGTAEWLPERGLYFNGGTAGEARDQHIRDCIFWENCYQGVKTQAGTNADGTPQRYIFERCRFRSFYRAFTNDDATVTLTDCTSLGGGISSALGGPLVGVTIDNMPVTIDYVSPPVEYTGGENHNLDDAFNGQVLIRDSVITISAGRYAAQSANQCTLRCERVTVTAVGSGASLFAAFLCAANGIVELVDCTVTGAIRPTYWINPSILATGLTAWAQGCDFSGCTVAPRCILDLTGRSFKTKMYDDTILPNLAVTLNPVPQQQSWQLKIGAAASSIASAATLNLSPQYDHATLTGNSTVSTINVLASTANILYHGAIYALTMGAGSAVKFSAAGNLVPLDLGARTQGTIAYFEYDAGASKWNEFLPRRRNRLLLPRASFPRTRTSWWLKPREENAPWIVKGKIGVGCDPWRIQHFPVMPTRGASSSAPQRGSPTPSARSRWRTPPCSSRSSSA